MGKSSLFLCPSTWLLLFFLTLQPLGPSTVAAQPQREEYIVYMGSHLPSSLSPKQFYEKMMTDVLGSEYSKNPSGYLLYTYQRSFYGCVALLSDEEAQKIADMEGVVSVFPDTNFKPHTTRSWDFMGFPIQVPRSSIESDVIIGVIDTGITPESPSFSDAGLGPVPAKWKGKCQSTKDFSCNKKIIGARYYRISKKFPKNQGPTPRDFIGHGTHTASTVAGALVPKASFLGLGLGTARGGVPSARIAVYKVCWSETECAAKDILAAFDDAVAEGVDIISCSLGGPPEQYFKDPIAIGSFHAMKRGVLTSVSAGNDGPSLKTVGNVAPWFMSVAASTIDRKFVTNVLLGNGKLFQGVSLNTFDLHGKTFPMIYGGDAPNSSLPNLARFCDKDSLNRTLVQGKILLCDFEDSTEASEGSLVTGAAGTVIPFGGPTDIATIPFPLPTSIVNLNAGAVILSYIRNLTSNPVGTIFKTQTIKDKFAPSVGSFSSRGPNPISPGILKRTHHLHRCLK